MFARVAVFSRRFSRMCPLKDMKQRAAGELPEGPSFPAPGRIEERLARRGWNVQAASSGGPTL